MQDWPERERYTAEDLLQIIRILRDRENGCPWDKVQTHASIRKNFLEETCEALEAIDADDEQTRNGAGYDHCFVLNKREPGELSFAARITEPHSGRVMEVYTTEPGVQFYSDNWADGYKGQHGATFPRRSALCFEAQHFPDSPNHAYFPSVVLKPGEIYTQKTIYKFGTV